LYGHLSMNKDFMNHKISTLSRPYQIVAVPSIATHHEFSAAGLKDKPESRLNRLVFYRHCTDTTTGLIQYLSFVVVFMNFYIDSVQ